VCSDTWLFGVDFPGVYVKDRTEMFCAIQVQQTQARVAIRQYAEISTTAHGEIPPGDCNRCHWKFFQGSSGYAMRDARSVRIVIKIMMNRADARVISET
jgi:hypothetical protein